MAFTYIAIETDRTYGEINWNSATESTVLQHPPRYLDSSSRTSTAGLSFYSLGYQYTSNGTPPNYTPVYAIYKTTAAGISSSTIPSSWLQDGGPDGTNSVHVSDPGLYTVVTNVWTHLESGNLTPMQSYQGSTTELNVYIFEYDTQYIPSEEEEDEYSWLHQSYSGGIDYYSITVNDNDKWIETTYSHGSGYVYEILVSANSETNYDGVVVCTGSHSSGAGFSTMTGWSDHLVSATGHDVSNSITFTPSSSGTLYIYFRTNTNTIYPTAGTTGNVQIQQKYKVTLNDNGGSGGSGTQAVQMGLTSNTMSVSVPTRGSYAFLGYYTTVAKTGGTQYIQNTGNGVSSQPITSNITLYARWKNAINWSPSSSVSATYSSSTQDVTIASTAGTCASGGTVSYSVLSITKSGTTQSTTGWSATGTLLHIPSSQATGTYTVVIGATSPASSSNTSNTFISGSLTKTITLTINTGTITVTINGNGGSGGISSKTVAPGASSWSISSVPSRTGFQLIGFWDTSNYSGGTQYLNASGSSVRSAPTSSMTIYARWEPIVNYGTTSSSYTVYCTTSNHEASTTEGSQQITISSGGSTSSGLTITYSENNEGWTVSSDGKKLTIPNGLSAGTYELEVSGTISASNSTHNTTSSSDNQITVTIVAVTKYPNNSNPTKYKNTSGTTGYNVTYGTPTASITSSLTAAGGTFYVTCSVTNSTDWYYKYTNGTYSSNQTGSETGTARWRITSNGNSRFSSPTSGGSSLTIGGTSYTTYPSGSSYKGSHSTMGTNATTDTVGITAYNIGDTSKNSGEKTASVTNSTSTSTSTEYGTPEVEIGSGIWASGGHATVTCTVTNTVTTTTTYTSGASTSSNSSVAGTARWKITSNGNNRFSHPSSGGVSLSGVGTVYNSGTEVYHDSMTNNATTDTVVVTAYNIGSTSKTATAKDVTTNSLSWKNPVYTQPGTGTSKSISLAVAGQTYTIVAAVTQKQEYTSGYVAQTVDLSNSVVYSVSTAKDGYSLDTSTHVVTVTNNESTSARNGFKVLLKCTGNANIVKNFTVTFNQAAGSQAYMNPVISGFTYDTFAASGATKTPTVTYYQDYAWNGVAGSGTRTSNTGGTLAYSTTGTLPSGFSVGSNFSTTGSVTWANNTSTSTRDAKSNLKVTVTIGGLTSSAYTCTACSQSAGAKVYGTPTVSAYTYSTSVSAGGTTDLAPATLTYSQTWTWNSVSGSGGTITSGGTLAFTRATTYSWMTAGTNFATTGKINVASLGTTISNARAFYGALSVIVTLNGKTSSSKTPTAGQQVGNYVTAITPKDSSGGTGSHFSYANIGPGATSASPSLSGGAAYTFTSGSTAFDSSGSPSFGGTATYSRTYSLGTVQNGFSAVNSSTGVLTATSMGTTVMSSRTSGTVTSVLTITYTHASSYSAGGTVTSSTKSSTATCTQNANAITALSLTVGASTISYGGTTSATVTATFSSGATLNVSNDSGTTYSTNPTGIVTVTKS